MEKVIYSGQGGIGLILDETEHLDDYIIKVPVVLHGITMHPDTYTDLDGLFPQNVIYKGMLKDSSDHKVMVFFIGVDGGSRYYQCFYWITETRIANKYKEGTVRDFIWKNNKWK